LQAATVIGRLLRQLGDSVTTRAAYLFQPSPAIRWGSGGGRSLTAGQNPAGGAVIDFFLGRAPATGVTLEFRDALTRAPSVHRSVAALVARPSTRPNQELQDAGPRASSAWKHAIPPDAAAGGVRDAIRAMRQASNAGRQQQERHPGKIVRDAIDAANAGWHSGLPASSPPDSPLAPVPPWMPPSWRDARRQWRGQHRGALIHRNGSIFPPQFYGPGAAERFGEQSIADRIRHLR
jgi:hypothetical protein